MPATTNSPFDPARFVVEEATTRTPPSKNVRFAAEEASFTEHAAPSTHTPMRRKPASPRAGWAVTVRPHIILALVFAIAVVLAYYPLHSQSSPEHPVFTVNRAFSSLSTIASRAVARPPPLSGACACTPEDLDAIAQKAALLASRGPVLRRDYALQADGGKIVPALTSPTLERGRSSARASQEIVGPEAVIDESAAIGRCWATGVSGQVGFSSPALIHPTHVTIDHIPKELAADIGRAPRRMILWGAVDGKPNLQRYRSVSVAELKTVAHGRVSPPLSANLAFVPLATFEYDIHASFHIQTFSIVDRFAHGMDFGVFVLEILDNWGANSTCLYRVRLHGTPAPLAAM